jgi:hypothetical protein
MTLREDVAVGWQALDQWGDDTARIERLAGGVANDVWTVRVDGHRSNRTAASGISRPEGPN